MKRVFLNKDQIENQFRPQRRKKADLWRDLFLFSIYAGGLRFSDVIELHTPQLQ
jgi:site-specific recombinase XerD